MFTGTSFNGDVSKWDVSRVTIMNVSDIEMNYLVEEATPNLSRKRYNSDDIQDALAKHEFGQGKKVKIIHKTG